MKVSMPKKPAERSQDDLQVFTERMKALGAPEWRGQLELLHAQLEAVQTNPGLAELAKTSEAMEVFRGGMSPLAILRAKIRTLEELLGERRGDVAATTGALMRRRQAIQAEWDRDRNDLLRDRSEAELSDRDRAQLRMMDHNYEARLRDLYEA